MNAKQIVLAIALVFSASAHASFYVDEDAPQQTAANPQPLVTTSAFDIGYSIKRAVIGPSSRKLLADRLEDAIDADQVIVTGFGDAAGSTTLAKQRATSVRQWFIDNGVPASKIQLAEDTSAREPGGNRRDASKVSISLRMPSRSTSGATPKTIEATNQRAMQTVDAIPARPQSQSPMQGQLPAIDPMVLQMVNRVLAMAQSNAIKADDALRLIADLMQQRQPQPQLQLQLQLQASPGAPLVATIQPAPIIIPVVEQPRVWTLTSGKSLKENLEAWAATAGWPAPTWEASNPYQITQDHPMTGTYMEVLGQLAKMVPTIDLQVRKGARSLKIVDARK
ncbi:TcpQ domain-containing protein [Cupriavidus sp. D39]|uniref:TcpQ domain-containing protein n=1 Tax=Cupriavidus sp. D39 TaxID=2997877 RepID=UPI0022718113|nr:TcpQ domain-containing protein [Cupriavidus sp. D39]MCY0853032.1 TcpQ domain-containing protein [Cupriavidus sp. D39]